MNKRRVVITGCGAITPIGCDLNEITYNLILGKSGIATNPSYKEKGLSSRISGQLPNPFEMIGNKIARSMSLGAAFAHLSMQQAIKDSHISPELLHDYKTGLIIGTGGGSPAANIQFGEILDNPTKGARKIPARSSACSMASSPSANASVNFGIRGLSFSISSACATGTHAIGEAYDKIAFGRLNTVFAGGCDEFDAYIASTFDKIRALSRNNDDPTTASRPYDKNRDGFVVSGGGGVVVLEEFEQAKKRGAYIYAEVIGYGATSDGTHMTKPSGEGAVRCMQDAIDDANDLSALDIDYINAHGTSTTIGDIVELEAIRKVFGDKIPPISSTKALTGHAFGAAGVHEIIFSLIMMRDNFIVASANIENMDPAAANFPIVTENIKTDVDVVMSNSFGFGGTNATLILRKL